MAQAADASTLSPAGFVAGLLPHQRPAGAPVLRVFDAGAEWRARAATGIVQPVPPGIEKILDQQGAWHTPLTHPGMSGPYDVRQWHSSTSPTNSARR